MVGKALLTVLGTEQRTRKTKSLSSWNLHAGELSIEVTVLQLENYQLRLCPECLRNTKAVTETLPAHQEFQERQIVLTLKTLTVSE